MPRIAPVTGKSDVAAEHHAVVDDVLKIFGSIRGPFSMLLHSPKLAARLLPLVTFNREDNVVEPKLRSVAILSAVRERGGLCVVGPSWRRPPQRLARRSHRPDPRQG
jgi:hypothetical protein